MAKHEHVGVMIEVLHHTYGDSVVVFGTRSRQEQRANVV